MGDEEHQKKAAAVRRYFDGDVVGATAFFDTDYEQEVLEKYVACKASHNEAVECEAEKAFYGGLFRELREDLGVLNKEFHAHRLKLVRVDDPDRMWEGRALGDTNMGRMIFLRMIRLWKGRHLLLHPTQRLRNERPSTGDPVPEERRWHVQGGE